MLWSKSHGSRRSMGVALLRIGLLLTLIVFALGIFAQQKTPDRHPVKMAPSAVVQMETLRGIKTSKTPTQNKIDSRLYLGVLKMHNDARTALLPDFRFVTGEADGRVPVDILLTNSAGLKPVLEELESLGEVVKGSSRAFRRISARVHLENLEALAAMPEVLRVRQAIPMFVNKVDTSEGDKTHGAEEARNFFGVTGAGVKIGVISDGVDSLATSQASGDLPPTVTVLPGQGGSGDEGTAMLEIVHDLAPGADLFFATAVVSEAQFAQNILDLAAAGCNIIVDDIIYLDESPFEDSAVAQAVNTVTAGGVFYFSSAGNEGNADDLTSGTWEGDFAPSAAADPGPLAGASLHDFGDGGNSILVEFGGGNPPLLIWAEHYDLANGFASTDFDIYDMDGGLTTIFDASTDVQDGTGGDDFPIEFIGGGTFGGERLLVDRFAAGATSSVPAFNLIVFRGELDDALATSGATRGHSATANAFSIAATPAGPSFNGISMDGPFPGLFTSVNESEDFTSDGPRRILLDGTTGTEITPGDRTSTGGVVRAKPNYTAADGVSTSAPGFNPFYGTSASAPHAAAIAGLLKAVVPGLTRAALDTALATSAIDIETAGTDRDTGAGIVMAHAALAAVGATGVAHLDAGAPVATEALGDGDAFIEPSEIHDFTIPLTNDGGDTATSVSAVLATVTPGVTILSSTLVHSPIPPSHITVMANNSTYPDIAAAGTENNDTPFRVRFDNSFLCGAVAHFTLTVTYTGGTASPQVFDIDIQVGEPGTPLAFSFTGPAVAIPDGGDFSGTNPGAPAAADLLVAAVPGNVYDVNLSIDGTSCDTVAGSTTVGVDHSFVNDLEISLKSPTGTTDLVIDNIDGGSNNFCNTVLDDEGGGSSIQGATTAPFTGTFTPANPLASFQGDSPNGTWQLIGQDFFAIDTGHIRAYTLTITPAICDAPALVNDVTGTKTVSGTFVVGGTVTYTVVLTNNGGLDNADNPSNEFLDTLPAGLTLVDATATSGTPVANTGTNTVSWNGSIPALSSVTITITATINASANGTSISNQGSFFFDVDGNGVNESIGNTDDPGTGTPNDATAFAVAATAVDAVTKTVAGDFTTGGDVTYTIIINNSGADDSLDNPGDELTDVLPPALTLVSATATSGTAVATIGTNTVTWNGVVPAGGSVTITIHATINAGHEGEIVSNQATVVYDADANGTNETTVLSDDPSTGAAGDATAFAITLPIPTMSALGLILLAFFMAFVAIKVTRS